jgi:hypothetical protein
MRTHLDKAAATAAQRVAKSGAPVTAEAIKAAVTAELPSLSEAELAHVLRSAEKLLDKSVARRAPQVGQTMNKTLHALGMRIASKDPDSARAAALTAQGHALAAQLGLGGLQPEHGATALHNLRARFGPSIDREPGIELLAFQNGAVYRERDGARWRPVPSAITQDASYAPVHYVGEDVTREAAKAARGDKTWAHKNDLSKDELAARVSKMKSHTGPIRIDDKTGLPQNPLGRTGVSGRGESNLGPILAQDLFLTTVNPDSGERFAVFIERKDTGRWAMPGGIEDDKDKGARIPTAVREFFEESIHPDRQAEFLDTIAEAFKGATQVFQGVCAKEPRNTDHMWFETTVFRVDIPWALAKSLPLEGNDDASKAELVKVTPELIASLHGDHPDFVTQALAR